MNGLNARERQILSLAHNNDDKLLLVQTDKIGRVLQINGNFFYSEKDPNLRTDYLSAFDDLLKKKFIIYKKENEFHLTDKGLDMALSMEKNC